MSQMFYNLIKFKLTHQTDNICMDSSYKVELGNLEEVMIRAIWRSKHWRSFILHFQWFRLVQLRWRIWWKLDFMSALATWLAWEDQHTSLLHTWRWRVKTSMINYGFFPVSHFWWVTIDRERTPYSKMSDLFSSLTMMIYFTHKNKNIFFVMLIF